MISGNENEVNKSLEQVNKKCEAVEPLSRKLVVTQRSVTNSVNVDTKSVVPNHDTLMYISQKFENVKTSTSNITRTCVLRSL